MAWDVSVWQREIEVLRPVATGSDVQSPLKRATRALAYCLGGTQLEQYSMAHCAFLFFRVILLVLISGAARGSAQNLDLGVLEDVPGAYAGQPNQHSVRVLFQKNGSDWEAFPNNCPDQGCLKTISSKYPREVTWTVVLDGRDLGQVTGRTPKEFEFYSHVGLQEVVSTGAIPTVGKKSAVYGGFTDVSVYRPLVAVSRPYFNDPESWKPSNLSADMIRLLRQEFRKRFPTVSNCTSPADAAENPWLYNDENIRILKQYSSNRQWSVVQVRLGEYRCNGPPDDPFLDYWFALSPANDITLLGNGMWLVDAGDYDNDGKSELVFAIDRYNQGGYELFYADFKKHATFEFGYH